MEESDTPRKPPSRARGSVRWWAEKLFKEVCNGVDAADVELEDTEATIQALEGMVKRIRRRKT